MSVIPRNKKNIGVKFNKKNKNKNTIKQSTNAIETIYAKHNVGEFSVCRSAKLITHDGTITEVHYNKVVGNMRASVLVFKSSSLTFDPESKIIYDLVQLQYDKKERDRKKYEMDIAETKDRMDILHKTDTKLDDAMGLNSSKGEHDSVHTNIMEMLKLEEKSEDKIEIIINDEDTFIGEIENVQDMNSSINVEQDPIQLNNSPQLDNSPQLYNSPVPDNAIPSDNIIPVEISNINVGKKRIDISINAEPIPVDLPKRIAGNKHHRNFISDLTSKFKLQQYSQYKFLELKVGSSFMIIDNPGVFRVSITDVDKDILIIGDLQQKSSVLKEIDPNYGASDVLKDQEKFMEQIKTKESDGLDTSNMPELTPVENPNQKPLVDFPNHFQPGVISKNSTDSDSDSDTNSDVDIVII